MDKTTEDLLLEKTGRNRLAIEKLEDENKQLWAKLKHIESKLSSNAISRDWINVPDRESYLTGKDETT